MLKPQRRVFLKVIATGPLVACAGADLGDSSPGGFAGTETNSAGVAGAGSAGSKAVSSGGGSSVGSSGSSGGTSSNPFFSSGSSSGGNAFGSTSSTGTAGIPTSAGSGGTAVVGAGGSGVVTGNPNPGDIVAKVSEIALGSFQIVGGLYFMGRDANGVYAMSMQCTHKFCALVIAGSELDCPCHHSRFDRSGNVLVGPATEPLPYYKVYVDAAGNLSVDKYAIVTRATRLAV